MRKVGAFFGGVLIIDGIVILLMASRDAGMSGGAGLGGGVMLLIGIALALLSLGRLVKDRDQSWVSWAVGLIAGVLFAAFYAFGLVAALLFAFLPGGRTPRRTVTTFGAKQFEQPQAKTHYDASGKRVGTTLEDGKHYSATGDYMGRTLDDGTEYDASGKRVGTTLDG